MLVPCELPMVKSWDFVEPVAYCLPLAFRHFCPMPHKNGGKLGIREMSL